MKYALALTQQHILRLAGTVSVKGHNRRIVFPPLLPEVYHRHGSFPDYPPSFKISLPVAMQILDSMRDEEIDDDRDFINDDGGYYIVTDNAAEFLQHTMGRDLTLTSCEGGQEIHFESEDAESSWGCLLWLFNNEYAISLYAPLDTFPSDFKQLLAN